MKTENYYFMKGMKKYKWTTCIYIWIINKLLEQQSVRDIKYIYNATVQKNTFVYSFNTKIYHKINNYKAQFGTLMA